MSNSSLPLARRHAQSPAHSGDGPTRDGLALSGALAIALLAMAGAACVVNGYFVVVIAGVDVVVFVVLAELMHIRELTTVLDTVLRRRRGRHVAA